MAETRDSVIDPGGESESTQKKRGFFAKITYAATLIAVVTSLFLLWLQISADPDEKELLISVPAALTFAWSILVAAQRKKLNEMESESLPRCTSSSVFTFLI